MNYRYCLGQDGHALQRNVDTLLLAVKQADGCEPRHVRCDRKRKRSFSGLRAPSASAHASTSIKHQAGRTGRPLEAKLNFFRITSLIGNSDFDMNFERAVVFYTPPPPSCFPALACSHACSRLWSCRRGACRGAVTVTSTAISTSTCAGAGAGVW